MQNQYKMVRDPTFTFRDAQKLMWSVLAGVKGDSINCTAPLHSLPFSFRVYCVVSKLSVRL